MEVTNKDQAEAVRNFYRRQGAEQEQLRVLQLIDGLLCDCRFGYPDTLRTYYKTSGNETRESLQAEFDWQQQHMYCNYWNHELLVAQIKGENK